MSVADSYAGQVAPYVELWKEEKPVSRAARPARANSREGFERLRSERDQRLAATDYLLMPDYPLSDDQRTILQVYRQALRDLPSQEGAPWDGGGRYGDPQREGGGMEIILYLTSHLAERSHWLQAVCRSMDVAARSVLVLWMAGWMVCTRAVSARSSSSVSSV